MVSSLHASWWDHVPIFLSMHLDTSEFFFPSQTSATLPETNIAPENRPSQKETIVFQPSIF